MTLVDEAVAAGARFQPACELLGLSARTVQRWKAEDVPPDRRVGPKTSPTNKLSPAERKRIVEIATSPEHRDLSPNQIVPLLADQGIYVASESSFYRVLREAGLNQHREPSRPASSKAPRALVATGPNQVWSWDITYLPSPVRGRFFYLYLVLDIWSRKVVGTAVHEEETSEHAAALIARACADEGVAEDQLVLHSDNGSPMKGATMLATLQQLGVATSFSRPRVSNDNPFAESIFKTAKYRPWYPSRPFTSLGDARDWVGNFVVWYNDCHFHSAIRFVTPADRHSGEDVAILRKRRQVYERARRRNPQRWSGDTRNWSRPRVVTLNPDKRSSSLKEQAA